MTLPVTLQDLQLSYQEAVRNNGIKDLVHNLRQENSTLKLRELNSCFNSILWQKTHQASGHLKLTHKVTHVIIEYQNHGPETVKKRIQNQILDQAQKHLNILNDKVFAYTTRNWKTIPDYTASLNRYQELVEAGELN